MKGSKAKWIAMAACAVEETCDRCESSIHLPICWDQSAMPIDWQQVVADQRLITPTHTHTRWYTLPCVCVSVCVGSVWQVVAGTGVASKPSQRTIVCVRPTLRGLWARSFLQNGAAHACVCVRSCARMFSTFNAPKFSIWLRLNFCVFQYHKFCMPV